MTFEVALIDHYDSFTYNLLDWLYAPGFNIRMVPFDDQENMSRVKQQGLPLVLSPGPNSPESVPQTISLVKEVVGERPILGICLGHQILGHVGGLRLKRVMEPFHGSVRRITLLEKHGIWKDIEDTFEAACYNSLTLEGPALSHSSFSSLSIIARDSEGDVQGIVLEEGSSFPAYGMQFHPESFMGVSLENVRDRWLRQVVEYFENA